MNGLSITHRDYVRASDFKTDLITTTRPYYCVSGRWESNKSKTTSMGKSWMLVGKGRGKERHLQWFEEGKEVQTGSGKKGLWVTEIKNVEQEYMVQLTNLRLHCRA